MCFDVLIKWTDYQENTLEYVQTYICMYIHTYVQNQTLVHTYSKELCICPQARFVIIAIIIPNIIILLTHLINKVKRISINWSLAPGEGIDK